MASPRSSVSSSREPSGYAFLFGVGIVALIYFGDFPMILLSVILLLIIAALAILVGAPARRTALWSSGIILLATLFLRRLLKAVQAYGGYAMVTSFPVSTDWNINFLGIDGLSLVMLLRPRCDVCGRLLPAIAQHRTRLRLLVSSSRGARGVRLLDLFLLCFMSLRRFRPFAH